MYSCPKKSGKSTFAAIFILTLIVLYAPRYAEIYLAANDREQVKSRTFEFIRRIIEASPMLRAAVDITQERIVFKATGAQIITLAGGGAGGAAGAAGGHPDAGTFR